MLAESLAALAAAGGAAVVQAAGTDAWEGLRSRLARWFGRGDVQRERAALERLDRTAEALAAAGPDEEAIRRTSARHEALWQARLASRLDSLGEDEREASVRDLQALLPGGNARGAVGGNTFHGPTAIQTGDFGRQENHFGRDA
ncbi:hypothetical protein GCM10009663_56530 [Kitasatospora arboriphila]|uniref:Uncharacterized protein n=1 Tax=Kitasatospora arboriphila TaxID=258052 RepID=A0ABN1TZ05_9ACTN